MPISAVRVVLLGTTAVIATAQRNPTSILIRDVAVIDARSTAVQSNRDVLIWGNRIADVRPTGSAEVGQRTTVVDGRGKFLIPGLWDMHARPLRRDR
jgi:imidazolonepropionase-like amidohydrolase